MAKLLFDPQTLPVDTLAGEAMLDAARLQAGWLRERFAHPPAWQVEASEEHLLRTNTDDPKAASVLIPIVVRDGELTLLLTQRTAHLSSHAGQISFPGGRLEDSDASSIDAALRETEEEIGLDRRHIEVLGTLPDYFTGTGYRITPVVALLQPPFELKADPNEVAEIFEVPLRFLMDGQNHQRRSFSMPNGLGRRVFYAMPYERFFIWGATAGILRNLFHFLRA